MLNRGGGSQARLKWGIWGMTSQAERDDNCHVVAVLIVVKKIEKHKQIMT
jgi:hypothetical protein